jgi:hypothetical protein
MTVCKLLPVAGQHLLARLADAGAVLLQTGQHDLVTILHLGAAESRDVAGAGIMALLRRSRGRNQNQRNDEQKSGHIVCLHGSHERKVHAFYALSQRVGTRFSQANRGAPKRKNACVCSTQALLLEPM